MAPCVKYLLFLYCYNPKLDIQSNKYNNLSFYNVGSYNNYLSLNGQHKPCPEFLTVYNCGILVFQFYVLDNFGYVTP